MFSIRRVMREQGPRARSILSPIVVILSLLLSSLSIASLEQNFINPPASAKPKTWVHAMSGNMSKVGFTKDLEAIAEAGIGGVFLFHVTHSIPTGPVRFDSKEHHEIVTHVAKESERLGLSFGVHNCDGWTSSGGKWNTPEHSMKMVSWSETLVEGGQIDMVLPQPTTREGFYEDVAVIAYPTLKAELIDASVRPKISASDPSFDASLLMDQRWDTRNTLHVEDGKEAWIQFEYDKPHTINGVFMSLFKTIRGSRKYSIATSNDGRNFTRLGRWSLKRLGKRDFAIDHVLNNTKARFFRVILEDDVQVSELVLTHRPQYRQYLESISLFKRENHEIHPQMDMRRDLIIDKERLLDLSQYFNAQGRLQTTLPEGQWTIMRFGFTSTSATNSPASPEGTGLENDKMNRESFKIHYDAYMKKIINNAKDIAPNALQYMEIDSFEVGGQNWTKGYQQFFKDEFNYSLIDFLPLYTGRMVESPQATAQVLWDIRRLNSKLITENYFAYFTELAHQDGLITYVEPYTFNAPFDEIDAGKHPDVPMGEFWTHHDHDRYEVRVAVSSGHVYGKNIISAEAFTGRKDINWKAHPGWLKHSGDTAWALGINEFVFHRYAHQPNTHVKPGMTMSEFGTHIDRTQTWWHNAGKAWFKYLTRGSHLLRQGVIASDLLVYVGEGSPNSATSRKSFKTYVPHSINFDNVNTDALLNRVSVNKGKLVLPDGTSYRALALWNSEKLSINTLKKIDALSKKGIVVIGKRPLALSGYNPSVEDRQRFNRIVHKIWSRKTSYENFDWETIFAQNELTLDMHVPGSDKYIYLHRKDKHRDIYFIVNNDNSPGIVNYHFKVKGKIPELWDPVTGKITKLAQFRSSNKGVQVPIYANKNDSFFVVFQKKIGALDPVEKVIAPKAKRKPLAYLDDNRQTKLEVFNNGEYLVRHQSDKRSRVLVRDIPKNYSLKGPWEIAFDEAYGFGKTLKVNSLFDWRDAEAFDLKHYSGSAIYTTTFTLSKAHRARGIKNKLDLGDVKVAARVWVNNQSVGTLWSAPYSIDISPYIKKGQNTLKVEVSNTWTNRLIGDEHYPRTDGFKTSPIRINTAQTPAWYNNNEPMPPGKRLTFSAYDFYSKDDPLMPSGLLGPVQIKASKHGSISEL